MPTFVFSLLLLGQQVAPEVAGKTVTLSASPMSVGAIVEELAKQTGAPLRAAPAVAGELLILRLSDADAQGALDRIALALSAKWDREADALWLKVDDVARRKEVADARAARRAAIARDLVELETDEAQMPGRFSEEEDPAARKLSSRLVLAIGADALADVPMNRRVVYAWPANAYQRPIPGNVAQWVAQASEELQAEPSDEDAVRLPIGKVLVVVERWGPHSVSVECEGYDTKGNDLFWLESLQLGGDEEDEPVEPPELGGDAMIVYPENAEALFRLPGDDDEPSFGTSSSAPGARLAALPPKLREFLFRPDVHDPLSILAAPNLDGLARAGGMQIVANVADDYPQAQLGFTQARPTTAAAAWSELFEDYSVKAGLEGRWLLVRPRMPTLERPKRADRKRLAAWLARAQQSEDWFDDLAEFALAEDRGAIVGTLAKALQHFAHQFNDIGFAEWHALRCYALLDRVQRDALRAGRAISYQDLPKPAWHELQAIPSTAYLMCAPSMEVDDTTGLFAELWPGSFLHRVSRQLASTQLPELESEPTEAFARVHPARSLRMRVQSEEAVYIADEGISSLLFDFGLSPAEFAFWLPILDRRRSDGNRDSELLNLTLFERRRVQLQLEFSEHYGWCATFNFAHGTAAKAVAFDDLPESYRSELERWRQVAKDRWAAILAERQSRLRPAQPDPP